MKSLIFRELLLVSHSQKRAKKIIFHPKATVIRGKNDTGKSSIIKSILFTFGAVPGNIHQHWKRANVSSLVKFSVDSVWYALYRYGSSFSLFEKTGHLIGTFGSITNQLGPELADIFNFKLKLFTHSGESKIPPPAYLFLPYYIDQDIGWAKNWSSFENLSQFKGWRKDLIYYHTGIHPNEWYELKADKINLQAEREDPIQRERILKDLLKRMEKQLTTARFDIDVQSYKKEINRLLKQCELLREKEENYKNKLVELETERIRLEAQKEIVLHARQELSEDYMFADRITEDHIECPTCGASYSNSFAERFSIACDEDRCVNLLKKILLDLTTVKDKIIQHREVLSETTTELQEVNLLLAAKQGDITLRDLIENEGKREVSITLNANLEEVQREIFQIDNKLRHVEENLKKFKDKERSRIILESYRSLMSRFLNKLNVTTFDKSRFKNIDCSIRESGSDLPRAILAYFFSILHVIKHSGSSIFCPIVIDAPKQQDPDPSNYSRMLEFIRDNLPEDSQLILSLVDDGGIDFGGTIMNMTEKNYALSKEEYRDTADEIAPYLEANLRTPIY
jgi:biotin-(acetyl-CoA carboxylase) ligase